MKILIAEDDPSLRRVLTALLEKNSYSVDAVGDGEEALEYLRIGSYDGVCGVLMDNGEYKDIPARDLAVMRLE